VNRPAALASKGGGRYARLGVGVTGTGATMGRLLAAVAVGVGVLLAPAAASADARVQVRLTDAEGRPVDGVVTLRKNGVTRRCRTTAARCTITAPAGTYRVTLDPSRGSAPPARTLRVPASGTVSLALTARPARTVSATPVTRRATAVRSPDDSEGDDGDTSGSGTSTAGSGSSGRTATRATAVRRTTSTSAVRRTGSTSGVRLGTPRPSRPARVTAAVPATGTTRTTARRIRRSDGQRRPRTVRAVSARPVETARRNLAEGETLTAQGRVLDRAGRPTDATLTFRRSGTVVGHARTTAGRFSLYDLPNGTYSVSLRSSRGTTATRRLTVGDGVQRLTLRVP